MTTQLEYADFAPQERLKVCVISPCGNKVAYTNGSGKNFNLFVFDRSTGDTTQLTEFTDQSVRSVSWTATADMCVFSADRDGDEFHQIFTVPAAGGSVRQLTDRPKVQHLLSQNGVSPDGTQVVYSANVNVTTESQIWVYDLTSDTERELTTEPGFMVPAGWSADGKHLFGHQTVSNTQLRPYILDVANADLTWLADAQCMQSALGQNPDGCTLVTSNVDRECIGLGWLSTAGQVHWLKTSDWSVSRAFVSQDGSAVAVTFNEDGYSRLLVVDSVTGDAADLPTLPDGVIDEFSISANGQVVALLHTGPQSVSNVLLIDRTDQSCTRATENTPNTVPENQLRPVELMATTTFDGWRLPTFVYKPAGEGPFPVVFSIHGGPQSQETPRYNAFYQSLLARGIAVVAPNIRGSAGYGVSYLRLIEAAWGDGDLKDIATLREFIGTQDWADADRMAVFGGSYGGFAVLSCMSRQADSWACGVDIFGPSNLVNLHASSPPTWRKMVDVLLGNPDTDAEKMLAASPITYADQITKPLFVVQGATDPRVVQDESDQIVAKARAAGATVRYDVYPDEGHGFTRRENEYRVMQDSLEFLTEHLND